MDRQAQKLPFRQISVFPSACSHLAGDTLDSAFSTVVTAMEKFLSNSSLPATDHFIRAGRLFYFSKWTLIL